MRFAEEADNSIKVTFLDPQGKEIKTVEGNEGDDLLSIAHEYDIDLEGALLPLSLTQAPASALSLAPRATSYWKRTTL